MIRKLVLIGAAALAALLIALLLVGGHLLGRAVKETVVVFGPKVTQTDVALESVHLSPLTGAGRLHSLVVGNPEGFRSQNLLSADSVAVDLDPWSLIGDTVVFEKIHIEGLDLVFENRLSGNNLRKLLENIEAATERLPGGESESTRRVIIREFLIEGGTIRLALMGGEGVRLPMPRIRLTDVGGESGGVVPAEVLRQVVGTVARDVSGVIAGSGDRVLDGGRSLTGGAAGALKNLFGGREE